MQEGMSCIHIEEMSFELALECVVCSRLVIAAKADGF